MEEFKITVDSRHHCVCLNNLKSLASLKNQRQKEENAFKDLRQKHSPLSGLTDAEILQFFELDKREDIVSYRILTKQTPVELEKNIDEAICLCMDSEGNGKLLYVTYDEAEQKCLFLEKEHR